MLATAKGYYNGTEIILDTPAKLEKGQKVVITYMISNPAGDTKNQDSTDSIVESLVGALPNTGKSLEQYREERLKKYANSN